MLHAPIETLKQYVNQPSGSLDAADVAAVAELIAADFASLGFSIQSIPGKHWRPYPFLHAWAGRKDAAANGAHGYRLPARNGRPVPGPRRWQGARFRHWQT